MPFEKASRKAIKLKIAFTGPSGSGKTFSALEVATGMGGRIAVIDTENGSASLYADRFEFDVMELRPPFTPERYLECVEDACKAGYGVLVVDSITHEWAGKGGLLDDKEALDKRGGGNTYTNWASITKRHIAFLEGLIDAPIHMICTMRSKQDYAMVEGSNNRKEVQKLGMGAIQRDGAEYEFTVVLDMAMDHSAASDKDRTGLFDGPPFKPTAETGKKMMAWLATAEPEPDPTEHPSYQGAKAAIEAAQDVADLGTAWIDCAPIWKDKAPPAVFVAITALKNARKAQLQDAAGA